MYKFITKLEAIDPKDGKLKTWLGPIIEADSWEQAEELIKDRGYLWISGKRMIETE